MRGGDGHGPHSGQEGLLRQQPGEACARLSPTLPTAVSPVSEEKPVSQNLSVLELASHPWPPPAGAWLLLHSSRCGGGGLLCRGWGQCVTNTPGGTDTPQAGWNNKQAWTTAALSNPPPPGPGCPHTADHVEVLAQWPGLCTPACQQLSAERDNLHSPDLCSGLAKASRLAMRMILYHPTGPRRTSSLELPVNPSASNGGKVPKPSEKRAQNLLSTSGSWDEWSRRQ